MDKVKNKCEGCLLLETGQGGENQLAHMFPGGCLYEDELYLNEFSVSEQAENNRKENALSNLAKENTEYLNKNTSKICIICKYKFKNTKQTFICDDCENQEERGRYIRNQSFSFNKYQNI